MHSYTIARLAEAAGVHVETIRYYQRRKLIRTPDLPPGGIRRYRDNDVEQLRFIKRAQAMGFTLSEIASLLTLRSRRSCHATRELAAAKLRLVDRRLDDMRQLRQELAMLIAECDSNSVDSSCPMIERLTEAGSHATEHAS